MESDLNTSRTDLNGAQFKGNVTNMAAEVTPLSRKGSVEKLFGVVPTSTTGTTGTSSITAAKTRFSNTYKAASRDETLGMKRQSSIRRRVSGSKDMMNDHPFRIENDSRMKANSEEERSQMLGDSAVVPDSSFFVSTKKNSELELANPLISENARVVDKASAILMRSSMIFSNSQISNTLDAVESVERAVEIQTKATEDDLKKQEKRRHRSSITSGDDTVLEFPQMPISGQGASSSITKSTLTTNHPLLNHPRVIAGDASAVSTSSILAMQASNKDISANKYDGVATSREAQRMSAVIAAGAQIEVLIEIFAELRNSIGRLRTNLLAEEVKSGKDSRVVGGILENAMRESTQLIGRLRGQSSVKLPPSSSQRMKRTTASTLQLNKGSSQGSNALVSERSGGDDGNTEASLTVRRFAWSLSLISSALYTALEALDAIQNREDFVPNVTNNRLVKSFVDDLNQSRNQLIEIAMLIVSIHGSTASSQCTKLIDSMVERISLRMSELEETFLSIEEEKEKDSAAAIKSLFAKAPGPLEAEKQRIEEEKTLAKKACHQKGQLEKLPIIHKSPRVPFSFDSSNMAAVLPWQNPREAKNNRDIGKPPDKNRRRSQTEGIVHKDSYGHGQGSKKVPQRTMSTSTQKSSASSTAWRKRFFFLDFKSLCYTHHLGADKEGGVVSSNGNGGQTTDALHALKPDDATATSLPVDHTSGAMIPNPLNEPNVVIFVHATYELTVRAKTASSAESWVAAMLLVSGIHRSMYERERAWFETKAMLQWWGGMIPSPQYLSVAAWKKLFESVIQRWPQGTKAAAVIKSKSGGKRRTVLNSNSVTNSNKNMNSSATETGSTQSLAIQGKEQDSSFSLVAGLKLSAVRKLRGHLDRVTCVAWSRDGRYLVSGSKESRVLVWTPGESGGAGLSVDNDESGGDQRARSPTRGQSPVRTRPHSSPSSTNLELRSQISKSSSAATSSSSLFDGGNMAVLKPSHELNMGSGNTWSLACTFSPSARFVAVAGLNQKISVGDWRYQLGRNYALHQIGNGDEHLGSVTALVYLGHTDGVLASGCSDSYLRLFDINQKRMIARFSAQEDEVLCLAGHEWIPSVVLSGGADCSARVHDVRMRSGMSTVLTLQGFESDVEDLRIFGASSTTANFVATASRDGFCRIHDLRRVAQPVMQSLVPENRGFTSVDMSPDGRWLLATPNTSGLVIMDAYTGHTVLNLANAHSAAVSCLRVNAGSGRVATGSDDQNVVIWQLERPGYW